MYGGGYGGDSYGGDSYGGQGDRYDRMSNLGANLQAVNWSRQTLLPIQKNFYQQTDACRRSPQEMMQIRQHNQIEVLSGQSVPPAVTWHECGMPDYVINALESCGFQFPMAIQMQAIPQVMTGTDLIGIAATGSGKTLSFLLPSIIHIHAQPSLQRGDGPIALCMAPTRELACQIKGEADKLSKMSRIRNTCVYGGMPKHAQASDLRMGCELVIATPGRLIDFLENRTTKMNRVSFLILDEADRMLDMGFEPQIRKIVNQIRPDRQTVLWSATWPREVQKLARDLCQSDPVHIQVGTDGLKAAKTIAQYIEVCERYNKPQKLQQLLHSIGSRKTLIFTATKRSTDDLCYSLRNQRVSAESIHGDKSQGERDRALHNFRTSRIQCLIATDVASRGLDVKDIEIVVNYDFPQCIEDYIHRIGRTGRAGASGTAYSFFTRDDSRMAHPLIKVLQDAGQQVTPELEEMARMGGGGGGGRGRWGASGGKGGGKGRGGKGGRRF